MSITIREITTRDNYKWDELIEFSPQGEVFLKSFYLEAWTENDKEIYLQRLGCFDQQNNLVGGQAFLHKRKLGILETQCLLQTWTHIETPIISNQVIQGSNQYVEIISALAKKREKASVYYKIFCHPSITDVRPLLSKGWNARPDYTHGWDVRYVEKTLLELRHHKRFRNTDKVFQQLKFKCVTTEESIDEFMPLFLKTAKDIGFTLRESFERIFRTVSKEMLKRDILRFITCRDTDGNILAMAIYTLNPTKRSAHGWYLAHVPLRGEMDIIPALYYYSIKVLSKEVDFIDIGEDLFPSLYLYKDSLGTSSTRYFVIETPHAVAWQRLIKAVRVSKKKIVSLIR